MSRLVSGVIEEARDGHSSFTPAAHPPGVLYRRLASFCNRVQGRILALSPGHSGIEQTVTFQMPLDDFDAGLNIGPNRIVTDIQLVDPQDIATPRTYPIELISRDQRFAVNGPTAAAWQEGDIVYLRGPGTRWSRFVGTVQVQVIIPFGDTEATALQAPGALLPLPDSFGGVAALDLQAAMALRSSPPLPGFAELAAATEAAALQDFATRLTAVSFFTADVWRP